MDKRIQRQTLTIIRATTKRMTTTTITLTEDVEVCDSVLVLVSSACRDSEGVSKLPSVELYSIAARNCEESELKLYVV